MSTTTADCTMSWDSFWQYYKSSFCTNDMKEFTLRSFSLVDALEVATASVQLEILNNAPKDIINQVKDILLPAVKKKLVVSTLSDEEREKWKQRILNIKF